MKKKTKRSLKKPVKQIKRADPAIPLPTWIVFWSIVFSTMMMIAATLTSAISPSTDRGDAPSADIAYR